MLNLFVSDVALSHSGGSDEMKKRFKVIIYNEGTQDTFLDEKLQ